MNLYRRTALVAVLSFLACACGGGGGSSGGNNVGPQPPPQPAANQAPTAAFVLSTTSGSAPLVISADASDSSDSDGSISEFTWDFAGTSAIGPIAQHTFGEPGTYVVNLTVTDDDGASTSTSRTVTVSELTATVTLTGTINILNSSAVDADLNDRLTTPGDNNSFNSAQQIPAPSTLGGWVNQPGTGASTGNFFASGDTRDFFQVSLAGGETILLDIAEDEADLDLALYDAGQNMIDASLGTTNTESLSVADAGTYFIEVFPVTGGSNYVLSIGQLAGINHIPRQPTRLSDPIIPGEVIIQANHRASAVLSVQGYRANRMQRDRITQHSEHLPEVNLPALYSISRAPVSSQQASPQTSPQTSPLAPSSTIHRHRPATPAAQQRWDTLNALKALSSHPGLSYAEPNLLRLPDVTPDDDFYGSQWHYPAINLPTAWESTTGSSEVIVAVVDTGVLLAHPDLQNQLVSGYDFVSDSARALDGDGVDADPNDPGDRSLGGSSSFHGTHVAGTIAAQTDNSSGVAGVAWQARIMPMRALGEGGGSSFDIIQAVRYAAGLDNSSGALPARRADIINLSLGGTFSSQSEQATYAEVIQAGVIVVASAGNESTTLPAYPASYDGVISVSATTISNTIAGYSNAGPHIDLAAPGGSNVTDLNGDGIGDGVLSTMGDDSGNNLEYGYAALSGTSMAAPHVAGVIALMKAIYPQLTPAQLQAALMAGDLSDDLGDPGRDDVYGYGLINAQKAVLAATALASGQGADPGPILVSSASTLNFGGFLTSLDLRLSNIGTGSLTVTSVTPDQPWVTVTPPATSDGLGSYQIALDRNGLADGAYQATINIESDANNLAVTLIMQVSSLNRSADAGLHYVILVDENFATVLPAVLVTANLGAYPFTINNVPAGEYRLFAGSDYDDDAFLCDAGEACGAFPTLEDPDFIPVNADLTGLDFESGFRINLNVAANQSAGPGHAHRTGQPALVINKASASANQENAP